MDSALVSLILITLVLFGVLTLSESYFATQDAILGATAVRTAFTEERTRTNLTLVGAATLNGGTLVELTIKNSGSTKLADFEQWDLLLQYYTATGTYLTDWYPYVAPSSPGDNQWRVVGIYLNAATTATEIYEPGILNPGEELLVRVRLAPAVGPGTTNFITFGVANGVTLSASFAGE